MLALWAKDNKFVENGLENWTLVNLDNSYHEFKDNLNWTSNTNRNRFPVRWASHLYKSVLIEYNYKVDCYSLFSRISLIPFHRGFFTLYNSLWVILTLHLSIVWGITWVPIPSNTSLGFLWVVVAKTSLFRCLLHINAAKKEVTVHLMRW